MRWIITRQFSEKEKLILLFLLYFLSAIIFFPLSLLFWYLMNRRRVGLFYPLVSLLVILGFSLVSYLYVFLPFAKYDLDVGIWGAIVYGGMLIAILFVSRCTYPTEAANFYFILYYSSYALLIFSIILWALIPSFLLLGRINIGVILLLILGLIWVYILILINKYFSPVDEGVVIAVASDKRVTLVSIWLLTAGVLTLAWLEYNACKWILVHK